MKKMLKSVVAVMLCAVLLLSCVSTALAAVPVKDFDMDGYIISAEDKPEYVAFFNDAVNALKTELPYAKVTYSAGIPENGITKIADGEEEPMDAAAQNYLGALFDGLFSERNSTFRSLLKTVLGESSVKNDTFELHRGAKRNDSVPVYGEDYVSALEAADDFDVHVKQKAGSDVPTDLAFTFRNTTLDEAENTSLPLVFSLPDGSIDAQLISGKDKDTQSFLSSVKFTDFNLKGARIVTRFTNDGKLSYYGSVLTYNFTFSYFEAVKIMSAILGFDIYKMCIDTINTILANLGKTDVNADTILLSRKMTVTYTVKVEITDINFSPRWFGDVNDNGTVDAADARAALRHTVGLSLITASEDQLYSDVDFDGEITPADARLILRMAVGLDEPFTDVPEGKEIKIVVIEQDHSTPEDDPGEDGEEKDPADEFKGLFDFDPAVTPSGLAQFIFDTIKNFENAEGTAKEDIVSIVDIIRGIVSESREKNADIR